MIAQIKAKNLVVLAANVHPDVNLSVTDPTGVVGAKAVKVKLTVKSSGKCLLCQLASDTKAQ